MEEMNNYFNYGNTPNLLSGNQNSGLLNSLLNGMFETGDSGREDNVFSRWLHPEIAENKQFQRENYFVDKENAFNEYMWNLSNEYNSPSAQMQRAKEAGINLNLAAGGIMGAGNAVATPMQGASGQVGMNTNVSNPIQDIATAIGGIKTGVEGAQGLGELFGFGKKNKAEINVLEKTADKYAEEANFTFWQKRQFRRTMRIMYDQAQANLDETIQKIENLKKENEIFQQQKWNIAQDTNLKTAQTGEVQQRTKNEWYEEQKMKWEKLFRDTFGVEITTSGLNMLVQAVLSGKGDVIIDALSDGVAEMVKQAKRGFRKHAFNLLNPIDDETTKVMLGGARKIIKKVQRTVKNSRERTEEMNRLLKDYYNENKKELNQAFKNYGEFLKAVRNYYL